jgi:tetratricopeptide (TPR) repeat protein
MKKDININGDIYGVGVAQDGSTINQEITLPPHKVPKKLTPQTGLANDIDFVGRKEELQKVDELLNQNSMLLLLNGIGGIGKSTLASYYLNQHKDNFDYYGFVQVNEDIKLSLASAFGTSLDLKSEKIDDLFAEIMNKLQNLEGKKLLIIDDVKEMDNQQDEMNTLITLKNSDFQILFTSRETKEYIPQYFLDIMSVEDARELFLKHYPTNEMDKVDKILEYLDYHTLFIEITAKTLKQRKRTLSLDKMIEKFANGEFSSIKKNKKESFNLFLSDLFSNDKILQDEENILFLKRLSVLPSIEISFEDLYKFLVCEEEERLEEFLIELVDNGWLIESNGGYKFHQILKEFVWDNYLPKLVDIQKILFYNIKLMKNSNNFQTVIDNKNNLIFFDYLNDMLNVIGEKSIVEAFFFNSLGNLYIYLGKYKKVEKLYQKSLDINKKLLGEKHEHTMTSYNNLADVYRVMGAYKQAEKFSLKVLKLRETILGEEHIDTTTSYDSIAKLYLLMEEDYKKVLVFSLKALVIKEKILGKKHPSIAITYNILAGLYVSFEIYEIAEELYLKALTISKKTLGEEHYDIAIYYSNLGNLYMKMKSYPKAEWFQLKALEIWQKIVGEQHPNTASSYDDLANFYCTHGDYKRAYPYIKKAVEVFSKVLPSNHPRLVESKKGLEIIEKGLK